VGEAVVGLDVGNREDPLTESNERIPISHEGLVSVIDIKKQ
jgi:hypothetical protein